MGVKGRIFPSINSPIGQPQKMGWNFDYKHYWKLLVEFMPQFVSISTTISVVLQSVNVILKFIILFVLLGQTIHILNQNEKRYINLRHLLIKWTLLLIVFLISDYIKQHTMYNELFALTCNLFALLMIYPSKFLKNLHLTYFCTVERKNNEDEFNNPLLEMPLFTKLMISITIFCLNTSRLIISFIDPIHRRRIEEAMRGVNMVIVEEKYFWKLYDQTWSQNSINQPLNNQSNNSNSFGHLPVPKTVSEMKQSMRNVTKGKQSVIRCKVSEFIEIVISPVTSQANRKFTFYRNVDFAYNTEISELTLTGEDDGKPTTHIMAQLQVVEDLMTEIICDGEEEPIYLKFKTKKEMQTFIGSISFES